MLNMLHMLSLWGAYYENSVVRITLGVRQALPIGRLGKTEERTYVSTMHICRAERRILTQGPWHLLIDLNLILSIWSYLFYYDEVRFTFDSMLTAHYIFLTIHR
jgi:hypothetical protein